MELLSKSVQKKWNRLSLWRQRWLVREAKNRGLSLEEVFSHVEPPSTDYCRDSMIREAPYG